MHTAKFQDARFCRGVSFVGTLAPWSRVVRRRIWVLGIYSTGRAAILLSLVCLPANLLAADGHWVATWGCAPQLTEPNNLPSITLANSTLRQFVRTSIGGKNLRVRFSNIFGTDSVTVHTAHIALAAGKGSVGSGEINPATDKTLTFNGAAEVVIPKGE